MAQISLFDYAIVASLIGLASYWFWFKKSDNEFDVETIKTFSIEYVSLLLIYSYSVCFRPSMQRQTSYSGFISKMKSSGRNMIVFYGSQTGTAEEFAARLAKEAARYGMKAMVADPEEYEMEDLTKLVEIQNSLAVFCVATYGEGDPTDNAQEFFEWLNNGGADLTGLRYAVFGLGNKTYEHYNKVGKLLDSKLEQFGAERIFELGLGDDDGNIEKDFITWKEKFWLTICSKFGLEKSTEEFNARQYELILHTTDELSKEKIFSGEILRIGSFIHQKPPFDIKNPFLAPITVNRELYKGSRSCMHIEIDIRGSKLRYEAGDHVAIYPQNDSKLVKRIGELLDTDLDQVFTLKNIDEDNSKKHPFPCPTTYRTALTYYVDITSLPRTHILKEIAEFAADEKEKKLLLTMSSASEEGKQLYTDWIINDCRSIVHLLEDLPSVKPPIDHLLEYLHRLQPRYYSISSSSKLYPDSLHITAVVINYRTNTGRINKGVATHWLKDFKQVVPGQPNPIVPIFLRRSQFRLPNRPQTPIIMIGPGTGLAPFRGFLQERRLMIEQEKPVGMTVLYFGCRKKSEDFLYENELNEYVENKTITKLYLAFSRDQPHKIYVTHLLKENMEETWDIIGKQNGHVYICGDARTMAREVREIILETIEKFGAKSKKDAEDFLKRMESQRRYSADVWS
ncbi:NADPH-cytochrome P450 reductase-like protein [Sarcoptes scabiei]|uniref:NADPH--cytochrome P450 reductase n=1 Tax=Sarcoptes scabiei TaxID=52283 RepID=A0A132AL83_SARSC|nr:NADPH-cytochrome P450 reductase-like protein [Sarcoptes scabiei]